MQFSALAQCTQTITDDDIVHAMKEIPGYLDITPSDFMEIYRIALKYAVERLKNTVTTDQIMVRKVITAKEDTPLIEVVKKISENDISGLVVVKNDQTVAGVISEKDFLKKMNSNNKISFMHVLMQCLGNQECIAADFINLKAAQIMSCPPVTVQTQIPIIQVAALMDQHNINRVPIVDENSKLVGIIARSDLIQTMR